MRQKLLFVFAKSATRNPLTHVFLPRLLLPLELRDVFRSLSQTRLAFRQRTNELLTQDEASAAQATFICSGWQWFS